jgi:hypothetical protein
MLFLIVLCQGANALAESNKVTTQITPDSAAPTDQPLPKEQDDTAPTVPHPQSQSAAASLIRAAAAYEYGDMNQVVAAARPIAEGLLPSTPEEQTESFRLLGMGLFLTDRPLGAENAFTELLRKNPNARLDPTTTRPELVAFFESVRRQHLSRELSQRRLFWNFLPPAGQFQNGDRITGWMLLGIEVASFATLVTTRIITYSWRDSHNTAPGNESADDKLRITNIVSAVVLGATIVYGVADGLLGYYRPTAPKRFSLQIHPENGGIRFTF